MKQGACCQMGQKVLHGGITKWSAQTEHLIKGLIMEANNHGQRYSEFLDLVNLHLDAMQNKPAEGDELVIVQNWHQVSSTNKGAYMQCVAEIMDKRTKE